jgi:endoglucanase
MGDRAARVCSRGIPLRFTGLLFSGIKAPMRHHKPAFFKRGVVVHRMIAWALVWFAVSCVHMRPTPKAAFSFLRTDGARVVDENGRPVALKGCNLGNWLLLEMWMLDLKNLGANADIPDQYTFEDVLRQRFGPEQADALMELYRSNWIRERDFEILNSFGFNAIRLPFHYSLLEDDRRPMELKPDAFRWLDQAVAWARTHGMYVVLDLHGAPGGQSVDHTTGREGQNRLWSDELCHKRMIWLWQRMAEHYCNEPAVAAYDLLNEPFGDYKTEQHRETLLSLMDAAYRAIREVDSRHIVIFPGTREGLRFYGRPADHGWTNVMFTEHHYPGVFHETAALETHIEHINRTLYWLGHYLQQVKTPLLIGEFNVIFRRAGGPELMRYYYDLFERHGWWATMWAYKLVNSRGGLGRDNWYLVTNQDSAPRLDLRTAPYEEIAAFFRWLGAMPYAVDEELREALTRAMPSLLAMEMPPLLLKAPAQDDVPEWTAEDIAAEPAGGQRVPSAERMDVYGGGQDIWNDRDEFRFVWKDLDGDFDIEAAVVDFVEAHPYSKAGLMIRSAPTPDAAHVLLHAFPDGQVVAGYRERDGANMGEKKYPIRSFPIRLKLAKRGPTIRAWFRSLEDPEWREAGDWNCEWAEGRVCAGLAVLSHDRRFLACASFDDIRVAPADGETR